MCESIGTPSGTLRFGVVVSAAWLVFSFAVDENSRTAAVLTKLTLRSRLAGVVGVLGRSGGFWRMPWGCVPRRCGGGGRNVLKLCRTGLLSADKAGPGGTMPDRTLVAESPSVLVLAAEGGYLPSAFAGSRCPRRELSVEPSVLVCFTGGVYFPLIWMGNLLRSRERLVVVRDV